MCGIEQSMTDDKKRENGQGSTYFRASDQRWCAALSVPHPETGVMRRVVRTVPRKGTVKQQENAAESRLTELKREVIAKGTISTSAQTVTTWINFWFNTIAAKTNRPKTQKSWRSIIQNHILPSIGDVRMIKLTPKHIRKLEDDIVAKGLRPTAVTAYSIMSIALEYALREGLVTSKVTDRVDPPVVVKAKLVILTPDDAINVLRTVADDRLGSLRASNILTGARQGELLGLELDRVTRVADLSWQLQYISWSHGCGGVVATDEKSGKDIYECGFKNAASCPGRSIICPPDWEYRQLNNGMLLSRPKSDAGRRIVPIVEPLRSIIERRIEVAATEPNPHGLLWTADPKKDRHGRLQPLDGEPVAPSWDNANWHDALTRAGAPQTRLHDARHTTASLLRKAGVPTPVITQILGHSTQAMTEAYIDYDLDQKFEAMTNMSALMLELMTDPVMLELLNRPMIAS